MIKSIQIHVFYFGTRPNEIFQCHGHLFHQTKLQISERLNHLVTLKQKYPLKFTPPLLCAFFEWLSDVMSIRWEKFHGKMIPTIIHNLYSFGQLMGSCSPPLRLKKWYICVHNQLCLPKCSMMSNILSIVQDYPTWMLPGSKFSSFSGLFTRQHQSLF